MSKLNHLIVNKNKENEILAKLSEQGIAIIPDFLDATMLDGLNEEFEEILETSDTTGLKSIDYSNGRGKVIVLPKLDKTIFPKTSEVFSSSFMKEITNSYFEGKPHNLNKEIFVVNDVVGTSHHANNLHFDVIPTFKFFIYLSDTTTQNGAFSCVPGSHHTAKGIREKLGDDISYEKRELSRDLPVTEEDVVPIEGKAGTLIIFTTEVFHRAGKVFDGERRVMRGHCRPVNANKSKKKKSFLRRVLNKINL